MASTIILSDNGASSGSAGLKQTAGNDGVLILQTTTSGGTATNAIYVDTSQLVGLGTTPAAKLHLLTTGNTTADGVRLTFGSEARSHNIYSALATGRDLTIAPYRALTINTGSGTNEGVLTLNAYEYTVFGAGSSYTEAARLKSGGTFILQGGSTSATGTGITFPATQSASSDANTLDDYEEGTWTPTIGLGTFTYGSARYTKVGRIVTVSAYCQNFSDRSTASNLAIGGLPFASASSGSDAVGSMFMRYTNNPVTAVYISTNTSTILFYGSVSGNYANLLHSNLNNSLAEIYFTITYTTNT